MERPSYLPQRSNKLAEQAVAGLGGASPPHLSIAGNKFTLVDGAGNEKPLSQFNRETGVLYCDVVIADINENVSKIYFKEKFDPSASEYKPPTCFSDNGVAPSSQAAEPQCLTCAACPHNAWGSKISEQSGKQVKACNDLKKMAFIVPGEAMPFLLRVPPATLKNFKSYAQTVAGHGADLCEVTTRISFESQGVLKFEPIGWIDQTMAAALSALEASKATDALVGRNDIPNTRPIGTALPGQQPAPSLPAPAPVQAAPAFMQPAAVAPPPAFIPPPAPPGYNEKFFNQPQPVMPTPGAQFMDDSTRGIASAAPAPRAKRRTKAEMEAARAAETPPGVPFTAPSAASIPAPQQTPAAAATPTPGASPSDDIPPFLRRAQPAPAPAPQQSFGMAAPQPAPAGLAAQLDAAFKLPTT